jgi:hypothetical protein
MVDQSSSRLRAPAFSSACLNLYCRSTGTDFHAMGNALTEAGCFRTGTKEAHGAPQDGDRRSAARAAGALR